MLQYCKGLQDRSISQGGSAESDGCGRHAQPGCDRSQPLSTVDGVVPALRMENARIIVIDAPR
jgi:hypothetical protein